MENNNKNNNTNGDGKNLKSHFMKELNSTIVAKPKGFFQCARSGIVNLLKFGIFIRWVGRLLSVFVLCTLGVLSYYSWQHNKNIIKLESNLINSINNSAKLCASQDITTWKKLDDVLEKFSERENVIVQRLRAFLEDLQYFSHDPSSNSDENDKDFEFIEKLEDCDQVSEEEEIDEKDLLRDLDIDHDVATAVKKNKGTNAKSNLKQTNKDKNFTWLDRAKRRKTYNPVNIYDGRSRILDWGASNAIDKRCIALMVDSVRTAFVGKSRDVEINLRALSICRNNEPRSSSSVLPSNDEYSILGLVFSLGNECASLKRNNPSSLGRKWSALLGRNGLLEFGEIVVNDAESEVCESISKMITTSTISHEKLSKLLSKDFLDKIESAKIRDLVTSLSEHIKFAEDVEAAVVM